MGKFEITSIWYEADEWAELFSENDDNMDVIFTLSDGTKWIASFFTYRNILSLARKNKETGECLNGLYFCAADMILIEKLTKDNIQRVLDEILKKEKVHIYCTQIEGRIND